MTDVDTERALDDDQLPPELDLGVLGGDPASPTVEPFEALYARCYDRMRRLAYVLVDTEEQAAEVVQEAFARLFPRMDRVRDPEAYVRTSVLNLSRRVLRRRGLARERVRPEPTAAANPHDHVLDAVRALAPAQRQVVVLRYYLQYTDDEIARTLGMRPGTVKSTLHRARQQLKEVLQP